MFSDLAEDLDEMFVRRDGRADDRLERRADERELDFADLAVADLCDWVRFSSKPSWVSSLDALLLEDTNDSLPDLDDSLPDPSDRADSRLASCSATAAQHSSVLELKDNPSNALSQTPFLATLGRCTLTVGCWKLLLK